MGIDRGSVEHRRDTGLNHVDLLELLKLTGTGAGGAAIAVAWLFIRGHVVPGPAYLREIANSQRWQDKYFDAIGVVRKQNDTLHESEEVIKKITEECP